MGEGAESMGFTDNCDVFASLHEDTFNSILRHIAQQRPSLFNYATKEIAEDPALLCEAIQAHQIVGIRNNPFVTVVDPLPVPGTNYGVNFAVQLVDLHIDFHPGSAFNLPPELDPPLKAQRMGLKLSVSGGVGCPAKEILDKLPPEPGTGGKPEVSHRDDLAVNQIVVISTRKLNCFRLDAYAVGGMRVATHGGKSYVEPFLEGLEIEKITPEGLESSLECLIGLVLRLAVLPKLRILLADFPLNLTQGAPDLFPGGTNLVLCRMPPSQALPNNPAIEEDRLKVFIKVEVV
jgi:hypothetical protein